MTERERILSLTAGPEMDREVAARLMRLEPVRREIPCPDGLPGCGVFHFIEEPFPSFSTDYNAVRAMEDEIERRGLGLKYASVLESLVHPPPPKDGQLGDTRDWYWSLIHASAADRCRAALLTVGEDA